MRVGLQQNVNGRIKREARCCRGTTCRHWIYSCFASFMTVMCSKAAMKNSGQPYTSPVTAYIRARITRGYFATGLKGLQRTRAAICFRALVNRSTADTITNIHAWQHEKEQGGSLLMRGASYRLDRAATANDRGWLAFHPHPLTATAAREQETCEDEMRVRTACSGASDPLNTSSRVRQVEGENGEPKGKKKREKRKGSCVKSVNSVQATTTVTSRRTTYPGRVRVSYCGYRQRTLVYWR